MGIVGIGGAGWHRWFILLLGVLLTFAMMVRIHRDPGVYWARVRCVILVPDSNPNPNVLTERSPTAIAALTVMDVNRSPLVLRASSPDVTLYGLGVRSGTWVFLENSGSQWSPSASNPYIDVQATGSTPEEVVLRIQNAVGSLRTALARRQTDANASGKDHATLDASPGVPSVVQVLPSSSRALAATLLVGIALTLATAHATDGAMNRFQRRRRSPA